MHYIKIIILILLIILTLVGLPFVWRAWVVWTTQSQIYQLDNAPSGRVAIVFGARAFPDGRLSGMLRDRVETGIQLYKAGKVDKLLMSGDNSNIDYDEPSAMMRYAVARGVPAEDIQRDFAGRRTYDTCYRARHIFQLESVILVTQDFHLPRALFTCNQIGLTVNGVASDLRTYRREAVVWSNLREIPATVLALYDTFRGHPAEVMGEAIPLE